MSAPLASRETAKLAITRYAIDACQHGARLWTYTDLATALGRAPSVARQLGPMLALLRIECHAQGLPNLCAVIVASGTDMPSRKSFDTLSGTWCDTGLDEIGVRAEQARVLAYDWCGVA